LTVRRHPVHYWHVGITGGRDRQPTETQMRALRDCGRVGGKVHLVHGGARGIDADVGAWVGRGGKWLVSAILPDYQTYRSFGFILRNALVVRSSDIIVSFGGGKGTADCVAQSIAYGKPVVDLSALGNIQ
jgi:hypothetical protein